MNVMLTCAGRRCHTISAFKSAMKDGGRVLACDSSPDAPALQEADRAFVVPRVEEDGYVEALLRICAEHRVGLLVPSFEIELPLLATHRARFTAIGTLPLVSSKTVIETCHDKLESARFLTGCGLPVPRTFDTLDAARDALARGDLTFPLVVKPRWGVSSIGMEFPEDEEELELACRLVKKRLARTFLADISATDPEHCILIQEQLSGTEYGLDVVNDLDGRHVATFAKRKLRMWAGQTDRAETVHNDSLGQLGRRIGENLGHVGILDCDVFVTKSACHVIDMNPRFGGGYPFSHVAGANLPAALMAWADREAVDPEWLTITPNLTISRGDTFVIMDGDRQRKEVSQTAPTVLLETLTTASK